MKASLSIAIIAALGTMFASAQNVAEDPQQDPVLEAIREFNKRDKQQANEVSVVLDPVGVPPAVTGEETTPPPQEIAKPAEPVLVTGKPPEATEAPIDQPIEATQTLSEPEAPKQQQGLAVRIEQLKTGSGLVDPKQVKLLAPFPAKPLAQPPVGWRLETSENAPPFTRQVEIAPGSEVTLTVRPHLLVPDADGATAFNILEPGYDPALGYGQTATVGAILSTSIKQLEEESIQLGTAIDALQQLLISLPKPEPQPEVKSITPVRKR